VDFIRASWRLSCPTAAAVKPPERQPAYEKTERSQSSVIGARPGKFGWRGRQRLGAADQGQRLLIEQIEAGPLLDAGGQHLALPIHGEAQISHALLVAELGTVEIALELVEFQ